MYLVSIGQQLLVLDDTVHSDTGRYFVEFGQLRAVLVHFFDSSKSVEGLYAITY